jgi:thiaminase/transcriptional activator TenA
MPFCANQLARLQPLHERMCAHPFLEATRDGTMPDDRFAVWMRQDYLFVEAAIPFISALLPKAPVRHWASLTGVIKALQDELTLFEERAAAVGITLGTVPPAFTTHAYIQFLMATAAYASYAECYTVLYAAEKAYFDSWMVVKAGIASDSTWMPFVENWAGDAFAGYVGHLERELDALASAAGPAELERMARAFELTVRYEIAFWEMAATGEQWPGIEPSDPAR